MIWLYCRLFTGDMFCYVTIYASQTKTELFSKTFHLSGRATTVTSSFLNMYVASVQWKNCCFSYLIYSVLASKSNLEARKRNELFEAFDYATDVKKKKKKTARTHASSLVYAVVVVYHSTRLINSCFYADRTSVAIQSLAKRIYPYTIDCPFYLISNVI